MEGCIEGCPVGRAQRGYIFKHVFRQLEPFSENVVDNEGNVPVGSTRFALVPMIGLDPELLRLVE